MRCRRCSAVIGLYFVLVLQASCTTGMPMPDNNNNDNGNGNANGNNNGNGNSSDDVSLTVQFDPEAGVSSVRVACYVDKGNVHRADAEFSVTPWDFRTSYDPGSTNGETHFYPKGTQICLICDESEAISSPTNTGVDPVQPTMAGQFVDWQGDTQGSTGGSDAGVLFFTLGEDRVITARFTLMKGVVVRSQGGAAGTGTTVDIEFLEQAPLTIPPQQYGNSSTGFVGTGLTGQQGKIGKFFFFRDGTVINLTVPGGAAFTSWSGDGQISGRTVTFTFGIKDQVVDLSWP